MLLSSISPLRRRSAGTRQTPRRAAAVGAVRQSPRPSGKTTSPDRALSHAEQHGEQVGRAGTFDAGKADDLARSRRERDAAKRPAGQVAHHQLARLALRRAAAAMAGTAPPAGVPIIASITSGMVSAVAILGQHRATAASDGDAMRDREHLLQPVRHVQHGDAAAAQAVQHGEQAVGLTLVQRRIRLVEDQQPRLFQQHAAEFDELPFADRQTARPARGHRHAARVARASRGCVLHRPQRDHARRASARD